MSEGERERGTEGIRYAQRGEEIIFLAIDMTGLSWQKKLAWQMRKKLCNR